MNINAGNPSLNNLMFQNVKERKRPSFSAVFEKLNKQASNMNRKTPLNNVLTNEQLFRYYVKDVIPQLEKSNETFDGDGNGLNNDLIRRLLNKDTVMNKDNVSTLKGRVSNQPNQMGDGSVNPVLQNNPPPSLPTPLRPPSSVVSKNPFSFYNSSSSTGSTGTSTPRYSDDFEPEWETASSIAENIDFEDDENNMDPDLEMELLLGEVPGLALTNALNLLSELPGIDDVGLGEIYGVGAGDWVFKQYQENPQLRSLKPEQVLNMFFGLYEFDFRLENSDTKLKEVRRKNRSVLMNDSSIQQKDVLERLELYKIEEKKIQESKDRLAKNPAMREAFKEFDEEEQPVAKRAGRRKKNQIGNPEEERIKRAEYQREYYRKQKEKKDAKKVKKSSESSPAARGPLRK